MKDVKAYVAELFATFMLCFIGAGVIVTNTFTQGSVGLVGIALANGIVIMIMIYTTSHISGAHINPAVTVGFMITGRIGLGKGIGYIMAQLIGGSIAGFALLSIFPESVWEASHLGTPALSSTISFGLGIFIEAILTFLLVTTIFATAVDTRAPKNIYGIAIGANITCNILMAGPLTGAAMNPARTFGTGVAAGFFENHLVYWIGPIVGGAVAALLYNNFLMSKDD